MIFNLNRTNNLLLENAKKAPEPTQDGFYVKEEGKTLWNSIIKYKGKSLRERAEVLIIKNKEEVYLDIKDTKSMYYRLPGGGTEHDKSIESQAMRECQEEARINTKNLKYYGFYTDTSHIPKSDSAHYEGYYTHYFVGEYNGKYTGNVDKADRDESMIKNGKFYPIEGVYHILKEEHRKALDGYTENKFSYMKKKSINESSINSGIDTIVFDFGGVLTESSGALEKEAWAWAANHGISKDEMKNELIIKYYEAVQYNERATIEQAKERFISIVKPEYAQYVDDIFYLMDAEKILCKHTIPLLTSLKRKGYRLFFLSNVHQFSYEARVNSGLMNFVPKFFEGGLYSFMTGYMKPDKRIYELLINTYNLNPSRCMFIDDKKENVETAISLGFTGIVFDRVGKSTVPKLMKLPEADNISNFSDPVNILNKEDFKALKKYRMAIIGEIHDNSMISYYERLLAFKKPEYFICEFADEDVCLDRETLKNRMDNATNGATDGIGADYQYNYWCYELAYKYNCKLIGCNPSDFRASNQDQEDRIRESYMMKILKKYENTNSVVQIGDHHLRSIPISKDFLKYCGDTEDDRGVYRNLNDLVVKNTSPIWEYFINKPNACICRVQEEYNNEKEFSKLSINESSINITRTNNDLKSIVIGIHNKYENDKQDPTENQNCQLCTWCAEAQMRGINILPRPIYSPRDIVFNFNGLKIVKGAVREKVRSLVDIETRVLEFENSRFYIHVQWSDGYGGHEFLIANIGRIGYVVDPQSGICSPINHAKQGYFTNVNFSKSFIARIDDKEINQDILKYNEMKYLTPWDYKKDIPYMLKHGMISEEDAKELYKQEEEKANSGNN